MQIETLNGYYGDRRFKDQFNSSYKKRRKKKKLKSKDKIKATNISKQEKIIDRGIVIKRNIYIGEFIIQFNNEEPELYIIGENISADAPILTLIVNHKSGQFFKYKENNIKIISKNLKIEKTITKKVIH